MFAQPDQVRILLDRLDVLGPGMGDKVLQGHFDEQPSGPDRDPSGRAVQSSLATSVDPPAEHALDPRPQVQDGAHGYRPQEVRLQPAGHQAGPGQMPERTQRLVEGAAEQATMGEARRSLMMLGHLKRRAQREAGIGVDP